MSERTRLALVALSLFLCLHLWGTPCEAVPTGELRLSQSERPSTSPDVPPLKYPTESAPELAEALLASPLDPRAVSVSTDVDESRKALKHFAESVYAEPGRKTLNVVPKERLDVAQTASSHSSAAPPRRVRKGRKARSWWREKFLGKGKKNKGGKPRKEGKDGKIRNNSKNGKANKVKKGRKTRDALRFTAKRPTPLFGLIDARVKAANSSQESISVREKGKDHRKLRLSKGKNVGSSSRSRKPQAAAKTHSKGFHVENVSQPKDQKKDTPKTKTPDSALVAASGSGHELISESPEPTPTSQELAMTQPSEPVTTQSSQPVTTQSEPAVTQSSEPTAVPPNSTVKSTDSGDAQGQGGGSRREVELPMLVPVFE